MDLRDAIEKVTSELKKIPQVQGLYLFGSYATGKAKPYSDVDICVIVQPPVRKSRILAHAGEKIDVHLFNELPQTIQFRVIKEGIPLYVKNKNYVHDLKVKTIKRYLDFQPILKKHIQRVLHA